MLREYRLTNFKAFGETVTIPIRPLTLIFGANSSGKSSIFQSLLLLKQTLEEAKNPNTALLPKGSLVDLGTYRDFVHRHETERNFGFEVRFDLEIEKIPILIRSILECANSEKAGISIQFSGEKERAYPRHVDLAIGEQRQAIISCFRHRRLHPPTLKRPRERFSYSDEVEINPDLEFWRHWYTGTKDYIEKFDPIAALDEFAEVIEGGLDDIQEKPNDIAEKQTYLEKLRKYQFEEAIKDLMANMERNKFDVTYRNFLPERAYKLNDDSEGPFNSRRSILDWEREEKYNGMYNEVDGYDISRFIEPGCSTFRRLLEDLAYLGPLRSRPERHYEFSGDTTDYVGQSGEYLPSILFRRPELVEQINKDLKRLKVGYQLKVSKLQYEDESPSNVFSLRLVDENGIDASIWDVGFGISQVLPIVAQSRLSEKKTLLIEQPEIHLHPAHQAELGDMFIRSALEEQKNTLLLETHSENLILRILRRIRETTDNELPEGFPPIRPEDVAVLYVQPGENGAQVIEISVTEDGDFASPWPQGFFDERVEELF